MDLTRDEYDQDPRMPCKYGINCYQKNDLHISKYKHPPKRKVADNPVGNPPQKKPRTETEATIYVAKTESNNTPQNNRVTIETNGKLSTSEPSVSSPKILGNIDEKDFIKNKFLVEMPSDFYSFWNFSKRLNASNPLMALKEVGLILVGPFEVLAGKFNNTEEKDMEEYALHWRYFYDPPGFQTVIRRDDNSGYHLGYFRDSPEEMPVFLAYNFAKTDGTFTIVGENLFAAVHSFLEFLKKTANPFMKTTVMKYSSLIQKEAENLKLNLDKKTAKITKRNNKILARTFNKLGFIVPYDKKTQVGYRTLTISNKDLNILLNKLREASDDKKDMLMTELQQVLTNTNIAIDECDFGTGIELGLDILCSGVETLNSITSRLLASCYRLVKQDAFAVIIESHMKKRKRDFNLSII